MQHAGRRSIKLAQATNTKVLHAHWYNVKYVPKKKTKYNRSNTKTEQRMRAAENMPRINKNKHKRSLWVNIIVYVPLKKTNHHKKIRKND